MTITNDKATVPVFTVIKQTVSVKQRSEVGDEVFVSVGQEFHNVPVDQADEYKTKLDAAISDWLTARITSVAGSVFDSYSDPDEGKAEIETDFGKKLEETKAKAHAEDADESDDSEESEESDELTYDDVAAMKAPELRALIKEYDLDVDSKLGIKELREAVLAALFEDDESEDEESEDEESEDEESEDEESEDEESEDEESDDESDDEQDEPYTEEELKGMKLSELQEIAEAWEVEVTMKKGADLKAKKTAYINAILKFQEEASEE
jgi:hypothetical protein